MGKVLLLGVLVAGALPGCAGHRAAQGPASAPAVATDVFRAEVAPLLARRCDPCHNPGGKMYSSLPFDDPATVASHPEGILKRLKEPAEHALVERLIASRPKS